MRSIPLSVLASALVAAVVGFGGTLALIIAAADAVGATEAETASWVTAICLAMAVETAFLSWRYRMPVVTAWSTPGFTTERVHLFLARYAPADRVSEGGGLPDDRRRIRRVGLNRTGMRRLFSGHQCRNLSRG